MMKRLLVRGFDLHCHVDLFPDPAAMIARCESGQIITLAVTTTPLAWRQNQIWAAGSRYVQAAPGLHPELVGERYADIAVLEGALEESRFIGEIGLDGSPRYRKNWEMQKRIFVHALSSAQRHGGRVVSIHSRRAAAEVLRCIEECTTPNRVLPILHWFSGSVAVAKRAASLGCYFSVNHRMLEASTGAELIRSLPSDKLLTETDAPFTAIDDRKTEPFDVTTIVERLAITRRVSHLEMMETIAANASNVFTFAGIDTVFEVYRP